MRLKTDLAVVVLDGARATLFVNEGTAADPRLSARRSMQHDNPRSSEQGRDKPGRTFESVGARRSSVEAPDLHAREEQRFVSSVAAMLAAEAADGTFKSVVVVAPPIALGEFRAAASSALQDHIVAWIDKDLTGHTVPDIQTIVAKALDT
ncbi:MAG: host attachment protein [Hyphomicrobium sp.]